MHPVMLANYTGGKLPLPEKMMPKICKILEITEEEFLKSVNVIQD
jgi:hypothetical protein